MLSMHYLGTKTFAKSKTAISRINNVTAVAFVNNLGSKELVVLTRDLWM